MLKGYAWLDGKPVPFRYRERELKHYQYTGFKKWLITSRTWLANLLRGKDDKILPIKIEKITRTTNPEIGKAVITRK